MKPLLLVVDDDLDDIDIVREALSEIPNAPELKYFVNADELLKFFREKKSNELPPLAIALDINLPGINGVELLSIIKKDQKLYHIPISMVTTSNSNQQKEQCIKKGASHFFTKPIKLSEWITIIQSIVHDINEEK